MIEHELSCRELVELVTEYLEGTLSVEERSHFEAHLAVCVGCRHHLGQMHETIQLLGTLPEETLSPEARQAFLVAFRDWKVTANPNPPSGRWVALQRRIGRILRRPR